MTKRKKSLLDVPMSEMQRRLEAGEKLTSADKLRLQEMHEKDKALIALIKESFRKRVEPIAPWFDNSSYSLARLCALLSLKFPGEPLDCWMDMPQQQLFGYIDALAIAMAQKPNTDPVLTARRQRGLELWNSGASWSDVAEALDDTPETKKAVTEEIKRYAKANNLFIRKSSPGAKRRK